MANWPVLTTIAVRVRLDPHAQEKAYDAVHSAIEDSIDGGDMAWAITGMLRELYSLDPELMDLVEVEVS